MPRVGGSREEHDDRTKRTKGIRIYTTRIDGQLGGAIRDSPIMLLQFSVGLRAPFVFFVRTALP